MASAEGIIFGQESEFSGAIVDHFAAFAEALDSENFVVVYRDSADSNHGTSRIGVVSGTSITFGAESEFLSAGAADNIVVATLSPTKFVVAYKDATDSGNGKLKIGDVSGTTITFGAATQFSSSNDTNYLSLTSVTESGFVIAFNGPSPGFNGKAFVGAVSGTTITLGAEAEFLSVFGAWVIDTETVSPTKIIVTYSHAGDSFNGKAKIGVITGTDIAFGPESEFLGTGDAAFIYSKMLDASGFVIVYFDGPDFGHGTAKIGTIDDTSITFGPEAEFLSDGEAFEVSLDVFSEDQFIVSYTDNVDPGYGAVKIGTVSGTDITFGDSTEFLTSGSPTFTYTRVLESGKFVVIYGDGGDSNFGTAKIGVFFDTLTTSGDLFMHGFESISGSTPLFTFAPPPDLYDNIRMYVQGLDESISSGISLKTINHLTKTNDYDPQLISIFANVATVVKIEVWDIIDGQNTPVAITNSGCYQIGDTGRWGWSTVNLSFTNMHKKYHYLFEMTSDVNEKQYGEFLISVPEQGRWSYPDEEGKYVLGS